MIAEEQQQAQTAMSTGPSSSRSNRTLVPSDGTQGELGSKNTTYRGYGTVGGAEEGVHIVAGGTAGSVRIND